MTKRTVKVASTAGFCFGVERAVRYAEEMVSTESGPFYSFGPVVHNETVVEDLKRKGLSVIRSEDELKDLPPGKILIRAHGISKALEEKLRESHFEVVDATCPFVKKIHRTVAEASEKGDRILIVGDPDHPEVQGILGWCQGPSFVLKDEEMISEIPFSKSEPMTIVVQTTYQTKKFKKILEILLRLGYSMSIANTICSATRERQEEAEELASHSDVMLVIGSPTSSNSRKLYEICKKKCDHTYFIQNKDDVESEWFCKVKCVGITAGASTPRIIIEEVQNDVRV